MAKVTSPLYGIDATGTVGQSVTFAKWKGTKYARRYTKPSNPNTQSQQNVRGSFKFLASLWKAAPPAFKAPFEAKAKGNTITPANAFVQANASNIYDISDIADLAVSVPVLGGYAPASGTLSGGAGTVTVALTAPSLPSGWTVDRMVGVCIRNVNSNGDFTGTVNVATDATAPYSVSFSGLVAGQYLASGYFVYIRPDGREAFGPPVRQVVTVS
jgi:hypothetical protein